MRNLTFQIDYSYCPKGHGDWIFVPASILYPDVFWCQKCYCFYEPTVKRVEVEKIDKEYRVGRAKEIVDYALFLQWKSKLQPKDTPPTLDPH